MIPLPKCNCRSCKPSYQMHANQISLNQCRYQSRALSASPSPPPIPPQPNHIQYAQQLTSFDAPPPPPRCYQLVPIRDKSHISAQSTRLYSFGNSTYDRNSFNQNNYENIQELRKQAFVVKDPRRKPYYYNELSQSLDTNEPIEKLNVQNSQLNSTNQSEPIEHAPISDELIRNASIRASSVNVYGSGGSLDHIF